MRYENYLNAKLDNSSPDFMRQDTPIKSGLGKRKIIATMSESQYFDWNSRATRSLQIESKEKIK